MPTELEQHEIDISTAPVLTPAAVKAASNGHLAPHAVKFEQREIDFFDLLIAVVKHWRMVLAVTVAGAALAAIISLLIPNRYTATAKIMPPQQTQSTASMVLSQLGSAGGAVAQLASKDLGLKSANDLYVGMLKSRPVADNLIAQYQLLRVYRDKKMSAARKDLQQASDISTGKEGLITVSVEDTDPKRAAAMANSYIVELRKLTQTLAVTEASQRRLFFEEQLELAKNDLATAELGLKETQQKTGMIQLDSQAKALIEQIGMLRAQISTKEVQAQAIRSFATQENPDYVVAEREISALKAQLAKTESQAPAREGDPIMATARVPGIAMDYVRRLREVKYREAVFDLLAKQFEAAKVDEAKQAALIQVLEPAVEPDRKSSPRRMLMVILLAISALFAATACALIVEWLRRARKNPIRAAQMSALRISLLGRKRFDLTR